MLAGPAFALTVITVVPRNNSQSNGSVDAVAIDNRKAFATANAITKEVFERINSQGEIYLTSAMVEGVYGIRVVSANPQAQENYVKRAFEILVTITEIVLSSCI